MVAKAAFNVTRDKYPVVHDVAAVLIERLDVDAVARANFAGGSEAMQGRFRLARRDRHGVRSGFDEDWAAFCRLLKDKQYEQAKAMLA
jgi:hypothetical protein